MKNINNQIINILYICKYGQHQYPLLKCSRWRHLLTTKKTTAMSMHTQRDIYTDFVETFTFKSLQYTLEQNFKRSFII